MEEGTIIGISVFSVIIVLGVFFALVTKLWKSDNILNNHCCRLRGRKRRDTSSFSFSTISSNNDPNSTTIDVQNCYENTGNAKAYKSANHDGWGSYDGGLWKL